MLGAIVWVAAGTLLESLNVGTFLPNMLEGTWATAYTNTVVQPLESIFNSKAWSDAAIVVLWGFIGLLVYSLLEFIVEIAQDWREATRDARFTTSGSVPRTHIKEFLFRLFWRVTVVASALVLIVLLQPLLMYTFRTVHQLVLGLPLVTALKQLAYALAIITLIEHCCLVLLRLFTFRTRLFGDDRLL